MGKIICWNKSCRPYYRVFFDDSHCVCWGVSLVIVFGERRGVELSMKEIRVEKVTGATGSRGDVFVVRTSKLVENPWKNGLFRSRYRVRYTFNRPQTKRLRARKIGLSPFGRRAVRQRGYGLRLLIFKMANNKVVRFPLACLTESRSTGYGWKDLGPLHELHIKVVCDR